MRGWQGEALTGVGRYMVGPGTALSRRNPRPLLLGEGAARLSASVEGTPKDEGRAPCMQPPPEEAFPSGEGGPGAARAG